MNSLITVVLIIAVILAGYKTKLNFGLFAMVSAYVVGVYLLELKPSAVIAMWPLSIFFLIMSISFFYAFPTMNGTLEKVAYKVVYFARKAAWFIPISIYLLSMLICGIGAGPYASTAIMTPIGMAIASLSGMHPVLIAIAVATGSMAGATTPISIGGVVMKALIEQLGYQAQAGSFAYGIMVNILIVMTIMFALAYVIFKGYKLTIPAMDEPKPFNKVQRTNLIIIALVVLALILPYIVNLLIPGVPLVKALTGKIDVAFVSIIGVVLSLFFKLGDEKIAISKIPLSLLITLCGMGMLIQVAVKAGTIEVLSSFMSSNVNMSYAPIFLVVISGLLSLISSGLAVVIPTLFPLVPSISAALLLSPGLLFTAIALGMNTTTMSPFSTGGGLILGGIENVEEREKMIRYMLFLPFIMIAITVVLVIAGVVR